MLVEHYQVVNTPIIAISDWIVGDSSIDMFAGLPGLYSVRMPPGFWADAVPPAISRSTARSPPRRYAA